MVKPLSPVEIMTIIDEAIDRYQGDSSILESAIGALIFGNKFGWRVLRITHSSHSYGKYEKILGVKFREVLPERTDLSNRSLALRLADSMDRFWDLASGKIPGKTRELVVTENQIN